MLHFGSALTKTLHIHISFQDGKNQYEIDLQPTGADELTPQTEKVYFWDSTRYPEPLGRPVDRVGKEAGISASESTAIATYVRNHLDKWRLHHFHDTSSTSPMKKTADLNDNRYLRPDGSNLPAFLYYLRKKHESSYKMIRGAVQRVAPFFDDFLLEPQKLNPDKIRFEWRHKGSEAYFDASSLSDGSLRFIALTTLFLQPETYRPSVILVGPSGHTQPPQGRRGLPINDNGGLLRSAAKRSAGMAWPRRGRATIVSTESGDCSGRVGARYLRRAWRRFQFEPVRTLRDDARIRGPALQRL